MRLKSAARVQFSFRFQIARMRFLFGGKAAEMYFNAVYTDASREPIAARTNTQSLSLAMARSAPLVFGIGSVGNISEIGDSVVEFVAVDVVKAVGGPLAMHVEPRKSMRSEINAFDAQYDVAKPLIEAARDLPDDSLRAGDLPREKTCFLVVVEMLSGVFQSHRKLGLAHAVAPHMQWFGKWSPTVSAAGLCAFYGQGA